MRPNTGPQAAVALRLGGGARGGGARGGGAPKRGRLRLWYLRLGRWGSDGCRANLESLGACWRVKPGYGCATVCSSWDSWALGITGHACGQLQQVQPTGLAFGSSIACQA